MDTVLIENTDCPRSSKEYKDPNYPYDTNNPHYWFKDISYTLTENTKVYAVLNTNIVGADWQKHNYFSFEVSKNIGTENTLTKYYAQEKDATLELVMTANYIVSRFALDWWSYSQYDPDSKPPNIITKPE
ncbi:hypothetical protein NO2_0401 [Candidatus Termititenax persephonae]|uniref:Uncharacterized protein n=1 Tax=Candidatus Termititenax persephonae TaxID=2218525 RepID=A0A388TGI6_9BACT|nr:hypothetical protein NO2_0401 [Candidatus Termititenax persephonae]